MRRGIGKHGVKQGGTACNGAAPNPARALGVPAPSNRVVKDELMSAEETQADQVGSVYPKVDMTGGTSKFPVMEEIVQKY